MTPDEILKKAADLISGERAKTHGEYTRLHTRISDLWSSYLKINLTASQVAFCMVLVKVARDEIGQPNPDDGLDASAYTALWAALSQKNA
jgi:hypothetical protein